MEYLPENKIRRFTSYPAWKRAVKKIRPDAFIYGDKDIGGATYGAFSIGEWGGEKGTIEVTNK